MIHAGRKSTTFWILACVAWVGCGQAEYDQLVQQRLNNLRSGKVGGPVKWRQFTSERFSYACEVPGEPQVTPTDADSNESEKVDVQTGSVAFQVAFSKGNEQPLEEAVASVQELYSSSGFRPEGGVETVDLGGIPAVRFRMINTAARSAAFVQVIVMLDNESCAMSVVGERVNEDDTIRFFDSFVKN